MTTAVRDSSSEIAVPGTGFTKAHQLFRESVRQFIDQEINPFVDEWEEAKIFPAHELFKKAGDLGILGLSYPEEYGGAGRRLLVQPGARRGAFPHRLWRRSDGD